MATRCCPQKMVGGVAYQLVEEDEDTSMYGCKENCIYTKDNEDERICFKEGSGVVQCFENVTACVDSSNCSPGQECDLLTNYCVKGFKILLYLNARIFLQKKVAVKR